MEGKEFKQHLRRLSSLPFFLLLILATVLSFQIYRQRDLGVAVDQADQEISETTHIMKLLVDMETGFRGYLLGGQLIFLEPYEQAIGSIHSEITALKKVTLSQQQFIPRLNHLESMLDRWSSYARAWIEKRQGDPHFKPPFVDLEGKRQMDAMRAELQDILTAKESRRDEISANYQKEFRVTQSLLFILSILSAAVIAFFSRREIGWLIKRFNSSLENSRKENEQYRAVFEGAKEYGISLLDPSGKIVRWSPGAEELTGYKAADVVGQSITAIYSQDDLTQKQLQYLLTRAEELGRYETEAWRTRKDGTRFWAEIVATSLREAGGELRGFLSIFRDHSKRRHIEQERAFLIKKLEEGIRGRDDFLVLASHELKTPMTSIGLQLQNIRRTAQQKDPSSDVYLVPKRSLDTFYRQSSRLEKLIETMLDVARLHSGVLPVDFKSTPLSDMVQSVVNDYVEPFREAGCPLNVQIEPHIILECDAFRIEQAVTNLLANALRYGCVGTIEFELKKTDDHAILSVRDQGPGLSKENQVKIFERFGRLEGIHDQGGLGLGLYIAKEFIEAHDGTIKVESEPGKGATFTIELPLEPR